MSIQDPWEAVPVRDKDWISFRCEKCGRCCRNIESKDNRCTVYPARPRVCRHYPFSVGPGSRGRDFAWVLCRDKPFHLSGGRILVKDWIHQNFPGEEREFLKSEYAFYARIGRILNSMSEKAEESCLSRIVFFCYFNYELGEPFLPQYDRNMRTLLKSLERSAESGSC